jgi:hypothetical protein
MAATTLGKDATFTLAGDNLTDFIDTVTFTESSDALDVTTFGNASHRKRGGLFDGTIAIGGVYDTSSLGPKDQLAPNLGTVVTFIWRPEGAGVGKPETTGSVLVVDYVESSPVAEIVRWTASLERDGTWTTANQV